MPSRSRRRLPPPPVRATPRDGVGQLGPGSPGRARRGVRQIGSPRGTMPSDDRRPGTALGDRNTTSGGRAQVAALSVRDRYVTRRGAVARHDPKSRRRCSSSTAVAPSTTWIPCRTCEINPSVMARSPSATRTGSAPPTALHRDAGRSTHCAGLGAYDLRDMALDGVAVLDALGWSSAHVLGVSLGGMVGQVMAARHAGRVRTLTSVSASPAWGFRVSRPRLRTIVAIVAATRRAPRTRDEAAGQTVRLFRLMGAPRPGSRRAVAARDRCRGV